MVTSSAESVPPRIYAPQTHHRAQTHHRVSTDSLCLNWTFYLVTCPADFSYRQGLGQGLVEFRSSLGIGRVYVCNPVDFAHTIKPKSSLPAPLPLIPPTSHSSPPSLPRPLLSLYTHTHTSLHKLRVARTSDHRPHSLPQTCSTTPPPAPPSLT
jgi:hypothetical protein